MSEVCSEALEGSATRCPYCEAPSKAMHFCSSCGRIIPVRAGSDYFSFMGLERRLVIDEPELEKTFYSLSRQFHPDYFMQATEEERRASVQRSSTLNDAYRTLRNPVSRAQYVLALEGFKPMESKPPPELLEEVFDLNMQLEELKVARSAGADDEVRQARSLLEAAVTELKTKLSGLDRQLTSLFHRLDALNEPGTQESEKREALECLSRLLAHRSYLSNLVRDASEEF